MDSYQTISHGKRVFNTGSQRDLAAGKGTPALISPYALRRLAGLYERGKEHYGSRNWEKGQPFEELTNSLFRHLISFMMGITDEDHLAAIMWNAAALIHEEEMIAMGLLSPELDNMPHYHTTNEMELAYFLNEVCKPEHEEETGECVHPKCSCPCGAKCLCIDEDDGVKRPPEPVILFKQRPNCRYPGCDCVDVCGDDAYRTRDFPG